MAGELSTQSKLKVGISILFLSIFISTLSVYYQYRRSIDSYESAVLNRLETITKTLALSFDGDAHKALTSRYPNKDDILNNDQDPIYQNLHKKLKQICDVNDLSTPIYTLFKEKRSLYFGITSFDKPYYRHTYNAPDIILRNYEVGSQIPEYKDENGTWLSAFSPIRDREGHVIAIVQVDESVENFLHEANNEAILNIVLSSTLLFIFILILSYYLNYANSVSQLAKKLELNDNLTQLQNYKSFRATLRQVIESAKNVNNEVALILISIEDYKDLLEDHGQAEADKSLLLVANILKEFLPTVNHIGYISQNEFAVLNTSKDALSESRKLASFLSKTLTDSSNKISASRPTFFHMGIAIYPQNADRALHLIESARIAKKMNPQHSGTQYRFYDLDSDLSLKKQIKIEQALRTALAEDEFELFYQPKFSTDGKLKEAEALLRWKNKDLGNVSPGLFIPIAEKVGLIPDIGKWILKEVCKKIKAWESSGIQPVKIAINVSMEQLNNSDFPELVKKTLEQTGVSPDLIELELTESSVMGNPVKMISDLNELADLGITIAIDDFGTGFSSFNLLTKLPFHVLKVDKSFVDEIEHSKEARITCEAIITLAKKINKSLVAEGVETEAQLNYLKELDCDLIQGYYFCKPLPEKLFLEKL